MRERKDGKYVSFYLDKQICERLQSYAKEKGQTQTLALERILQKYFENLDGFKKPVKK